VIMLLLKINSDIYKTSINIYKLKNSILKMTVCKE